ncbi:hypothetical protein AN191_03885 [Loktanella sp. 5RATIMAR09]|nr:hypothetical protein AN191_03885 [Loktanella sp. 5RATIMAR09]
MIYLSIRTSFVNFLATDKFLSQISKNPCKKGLPSRQNREFALPLSRIRPYLCEDENEMTQGVPC